MDQKGIPMAVAVNALEYAAKGIVGARLKEGADDGD